MSEPIGPPLTAAASVEDLLGQLVAMLPATPAPMQRVAPGRDYVEVTRGDLADFVTTFFVEGNRDIDLDVIFTVFSVHVGELMHRRGLDRAEAIRQASEVVRQAGREAHHQ